MPFCDDCGEIFLASNDECHCEVYEVFHRDYLDDDSRKVNARSFDSAAESYIRKYWEADPCDPNEIDATIEVLKRGKRMYYKCSAEPEIIFNVRELK